MKKILPLLILITSVLFITSCKKSDDKLIIGTWEAKTMLTRSYLHGVYQNDDDVQTFEANELTIEFKKDNTYTSFEYGAVIQNGTYSIADDKMIIDSALATYTLSKSDLGIITTNEEEINGETVRYEVDLKLEKK
jgi:hypothetical protein